MDWQTSCPQDAERPGMPLIRTPSKGLIRGVITSTHLLGTWTHFLNKRTVPCHGPGCVGCEAGITKRWHAWVGLWNEGSKEHVLFEIPAGPAQKFEAYIRDYDTLRGAELRAHRPSEMPNGRIFVQLRKSVMPDKDLPTTIDLKKALYTIWGLTPENTEPIADVGAAIREIARRNKVPENGQAKS